MKELLLIEKSHYQIKPMEGDNKYTFEGIFTEFDSENRNGRIYTKKEFMPHFENLKKIVEQGKCLGELDHPKQFETSLKNVSHIVEKVWFDEVNNCVKGRIKLLDTDMGKQAKALVDAGVPLHISSRAAGSVTENKTVKMHKLFTYDLVDTPGFENAVMNCVNESYGFSSDTVENSNFLIYEITKPIIENSNILNNKTKNTNMENSLDGNTFEQYSNYTKEQFSALKAEIEKLKIIQEGIINQNDEMVDEFNKVDFTVFENLENRLDRIEKRGALRESVINEETDLSELIRKVDALMEWSNEVTTTVSALESWSEDATKTVSALESWSDEVTTTVSALESWSDDATKTVSALESWSDDATKTVSALESWSDEVTTTVSALESWSDEATTNVIDLKESILNNKNETKVNETEDFDTYKNLILEKIENIVTKQQKVTDLNESVDTNLNESKIELPLWLEQIPSKFKQTWESLSESEKTRISKRANLHEFKSSTAINEFWNVQFSQNNLIKEDVKIENNVALNENAIAERRKFIIESYRKNFG